MVHYLFLFFGAAIVNNFVLVRFLGLCPFLGVSNKISAATGMGLATSFVLLITSIACYLVNTYILTLYSLESLELINDIVIIMILCICIVGAIETFATLGIIKITRKIIKR